MTNQSKKKLLFLCQTLPFPPDGGVAIRSFNTLRLLTQEFDVTALCFYRRASVRDLAASIAGIRRIAEVKAFPIESEYSWLRMGWDHFRSVCSLQPYTHYVYENDEFEGALDAELRETDFDVVHVDSLDLVRYLPRLRAKSVVLVHHNVESTLLERRAGLPGSRVKGVYFRLQAALTKKIEKRWCPRVALNVVVSEQDNQLLRSFVGAVRSLVVPNGVDTTKFLPQDGPKAGIVFVGGMTWFPNRDALEWFTAEILPRLRASGVTAGVTWVGRATEDARAEYAKKGVDLTGYVDSIVEHVHQAACYVVPLRVGGGTRLKILDAWALGKAVVSTSVGCEGLEVRDGENILVRDTPESFTAAVREVLADGGLQQRLGFHARNTAEKIYCWNVIGRNMLEAYRSLGPRRHNVTL